jgi:hypothetical protein
MTSVRGGLLSTAAIGRLVVEATRGSDTAEFVAVASRDVAQAATLKALDAWARSGSPAVPRHSPVPHAPGT